MRKVSFTVFVCIYAKGLFPSGAGERTTWLRIQFTWREGVQHGSVHPEAGRGRPGAEGRQDTRALTDRFTTPHT